MLKTLRQMWRLTQALLNSSREHEAVVDATHERLTQNRAELAQFKEDMIETDRLFQDFQQRWEEFQQRWDGAGGLTATETDDVFESFTQIKDQLSTIGKEQTDGE